MPSKSRENTRKARKPKKAVEETSKELDLSTLPDIGLESAIPQPEQLDLKKIVGDKISYFNSEIATGHATVIENERQLVELKEQVCRLEGAKYFAQQILSTLTKN